MKNVVIFCFFGILLIFYLNLRSSKVQEVSVSVDFLEVDIEPRKFQNCSLPSCFDLQRCMLNYSHLTVFIEPLLHVKSQGVTISPVPSQEFLEIRKALEVYAVPSVEEACIVIPGIDFLNLERFPSKKLVSSLLAAIQEKYQNAVIFSFLGLSSHSYPLMAGTMMLKSIYRSQFDISLPYLLPKIMVRRKYQVTREIYLLVVVTNGSDQNSITVENTKFIYPCDPPRPFAVCDRTGHLLEEDILDFIEKSTFVLFTEDVPFTDMMISLALNAGTVPLFITPSYILPFADVISWNRIALLPSSIERVPFLLEKISSQKILELSTNGQNVYDRFFSSPTAIAKQAYFLLEKRILPTKSKLLDNTVQPLVSHLSSSETVYILYIAQSAADVLLLNSLCSFHELISVKFIWLSDDTPPEASLFNCRVSVDVVLGVTTWSETRDVILSFKSEAVLFIRNSPCSVSSSSLSKTFYVWKSNPESIVELRHDSSCNPLLFVHRFYLLQSTRMNVEAFNSITSNLKSIEVYEDGSSKSARSGAARVLI